MRTPFYTLALLAALGTPVYADDKADITEKYTVLTLNETAERKVEQDRLSATLTLTEKGITAADAQMGVNKKMEAALKLTKKYPTVKVSTGYYNVWQEPKTAVWQGQQTINLHSDNSQQALELVGLLQKNGLQASGVNYYLSDEAQQALNDTLTTEALMKVKARSEKVAEALGLKVARFAEINPGYSAPPIGRMRPMMAMARISGDDAITPAADAAEQTVSVSINAKVYLK